MTTTRDLPETKLIPYGRQWVNEADIAAVVATLRSDWLTQGPLVEQFEQRFASRVGCRHAVAVCNATAALHLAMLVADVGPGDRVVTSPNTFLASANCAAFVGATPDFSDIDAVSYTLDPVVLGRDWKDDTRSVVAVDFAGQASSLPEIAQIARARGAIIIEDASHAVGGRFHSGGAIWDIGGNPWADMAVFSFHPVKTLTTGEGGMLVTNSDDWADRARRLRSHGVERNPKRFQSRDLCSDGSDCGPWLHEMHELGYNYRLTDLQCALGLSQFNRLDAMLERRREIVAAYNAAFAEQDWLTTPSLRCAEDEGTTSWHIYALQIDFAALSLTRTEAMHTLRSAGVGTQVHYIPVHLQPWYRQTYGYGPGKCPVAEAYYERELSIPLFPTMSDTEVSRVIDAVLALAS